MNVRRFVFLMFVISAGSMQSVYADPQLVSARRLFDQAVSETLKRPEFKGDILTTEQTRALLDQYDKEIDHLMELFPNMPKSSMSDIKKRIQTAKIDPYHVEPLIGVIILMPSTEEVLRDKKDQPAVDRVQKLAVQLSKHLSNVALIKDKLIDGMTVVVNPPNH